MAPGAKMAPTIILAMRDLLLGPLSKCGTSEIDTKRHLVLKVYLYGNLSKFCCRI